MVKLLIENRRDDIHTATTWKNRRAYLQRVQPRVQVGDVHPLAVDVVPVNVRTVNRYALVAVVGTRKRRPRAVRTLVVLQAKRRLVALGHFHPAAVQHVESGEHLHAVIVPATWSSALLYGLVVRFYVKTILCFFFFDYSKTIF